MNTVRARELLDIIDKAQDELAGLFNGPVHISGAPIKEVDSSIDRSMYDEITPVPQGKFDKKQILKDLLTMKPKLVAEKYDIDLKEVYKIKYSKKETKVSDMKPGRIPDGRGTGWAPKPCCGSRGASHKKICVNFTTYTRERYQQKPFVAEQAPKNARPLSTEEYEELRSAMLDREFQSAPYALTHKLSPKEVNRAVKSVDYDDYIADES